MSIFQITLATAALLCSMVGGFLIAFAIVIMPGIRNLSDRDFIQAFQVIDRVIQNGQPVFMLLWIGSILVLITLAILGISELDRTGLLFMIPAVLFYLFGVQLPTVSINVPLNNELQRIDIDAMNESELNTARDSFEPRWNRWNVIRTIFCILTSILLIILIFWQ